MAEIKTSDGYMVKRGSTIPYREGDMAPKEVHEKVHSNVSKIMKDYQESHGGLFFVRRARRELHKQNTGVYKIGQHLRDRERREEADRFVNYHSSHIRESDKEIQEKGKEIKKNVASAIKDSHDK